MIEKAPAFLGFTALSDQVFVREPEPAAAAAAPASHPAAVVVFGWGDGLPRHVTKYMDGFRALFPGARLVAVLSPISKAMFSDLEQRTRAMEPVVDALFPAATEKSAHEHRVLFLAMSNTGAINYAATINAYARRHGAPLPHRLLCFDSTPGGTDMTIDNLRRWGRAMALGTARFFPWPFAATQTLWAAVLVLNGAYSWLVGRHHPGALAWQMLNRDDLESRDARRLYLYSREDDLIDYADIERNMAEARQLGWAYDAEVFEGTGHVGHMRQYPEQYWGAINDAWERAVAEDK